LTRQSFIDILSVVAENYYKTNVKKTTWGWINKKKYELNAERRFFFSRRKNKEIISKNKKGIATHGGHRC
jgi:hypothetical protein